jgi:hypothetical protein
MRKLALLFLLTAGQLPAQETLREDHQEVVREFIGWVKSGQKDSLAKHTRFPLRREYPIPSVKTRAEFIARYNDIFDKTITDKIVKSNPATDWEEVGWRGIMFGRGEIWIDTDGSLIGVNYQSQAEAKQMKALTDQDRKSVHPSLQRFETLEYVVETKTYRIRIDEISQGIYRYASWKLDKPMTEQPDLILKKGKLNFEGSGGNHNYVFKNGQYCYEIYFIELGEDDAPPARLYVRKGDNEILVEDATIVGR